MAVISLGNMAWGYGCIGYYVTLCIIALGDMSHYVLWHWVLWHWVLCHIGYFDIGNYVTLGIMALGTMSQLILWLCVLSQLVLWHCVLSLLVLWHEVLWYWVLCHTEQFGIGYWATLAVMALGNMAWGIVVLGVMSHCVF